SGALIGVLDGDVILSPETVKIVSRKFASSQDVEIVYSDSDEIEIDTVHCRPFLKPDWCPELMLSSGYIGPALYYRKSLFDRIGGFHEPWSRALSFDLSLRATEAARSVGHVGEVLFSVPGQGLGDRIEGSGTDERRRIIEAALERRGTPGRVSPASGGGFRIA